MQSEPWDIAVVGAGPAGSVSGLWTLTLKQRSGQDVAVRSKVLVGADGASSRTGEGIHFGIWAGRAVGRVVAEGMREGDLQPSLERFANAYVEEYGRSMEDAQSLRVMLRFQRIFL